MLNKEIPEEVLFDIEMESYMRYNSQIANMYDWLGEIYTRKDIKEMEKAQKGFEEQCKKDYLEGKRIYSEEDLQKIRESWNIKGSDE